MKSDMNSDMRSDIKSDIIKPNIYVLFHTCTFQNGEKHRWGMLPLERMIQKHDC